MKAIYKKIFFLFLTCFFVLCSPKVWGTEKIYTFGIVPTFLPSYIYTNWLHVIKNLEEEAGLKFEIKLYKNIKDFENDLKSGRIDFAFVSVYHTIMAKKYQGYIPLVRGKNPLIGILIVRKDSPYKEIRDLQGKKIGFPERNLFPGSIYMQAILIEVFKLKYEALYLQTHDNVIRNVLLGKVDAGSTGLPHLLRQPEEIKASLKIIYETPPSPPPPIVAHPRIPPKIRELFIQAFLTISQKESLKDFFKNFPISDPVRADYDRDYKPLEKFKLEKYVSP